MTIPPWNIPHCASLLRHVPFRKWKARETLLSPHNLVDLRCWFILIALHNITRYELKQVLNINNLIRAFHMLMHLFFIALTVSIQVSHIKVVHLQSSVLFRLNHLSYTWFLLIEMGATESLTNSHTKYALGIALKYHSSSVKLPWN